MAGLIVKPKVRELINSLEEHTHAKTLRLLTLLDSCRYELREPYTKKLLRKQKENLKLLTYNIYVIQFRHDNFRRIQSGGL